MIPAYWQAFVDLHGLVRKRIELSDQVDRSGVGGSLTILTPEQSIDEACNCWPGIAVTPDGVVPVASCDISDDGLRVGYSGAITTAE